ERGELDGFRRGRDHDEAGRCSGAMNSNDLIAGGWHGHRFVVAAAVDVRDFRAHFAEAGGELAAMMDGMIEHELEIEYRRMFEYAEKYQRSGPKFRRKL